MEYQDIKKLIEDMGNSKLSYLDIEFPDGIKISMKKDNPEEKYGNPVNTNVVISNPVESTSTQGAQCTKDNAAGTFVTSPMVGTFYASSSPEAEPFVTVGSKVKKGDVLCIIEAMKLMNEIEAEQDGTIEEVLVQNGEMVDYAKPLFKIK